MNDFTGRVRMDEQGPPTGAVRTITVALDTAQYQVGGRAQTRVWLLRVCVDAALSQAISQRRVVVLDLLLILHSIHSCLSPFLPPASWT